MELNEIREERRKKILNYLIREYIFSGKPVASGYLMRRYRLSCSSATIRNDFVFLEREGFIKQPHISAGRVPTEHGYRKYLDSLKRIPPLSKEIEKEVYLFYRDSEKEVEDLIKKTAMILNRLTNYSSLVYAPFFGEDRFKHLDLVFLSSTSLLLVLITNTGRVLKKVVDFDFKVRPIEVDYIERKLNSFFSRMKLAEIKGIIKKRMHPFDENEEKKMKITEKVFNELLKIVFKEEEKNIFTGGPLDIFEKAGFDNMNRTVSVLDKIDEDYSILKIFGKNLIENGIIVKIGTGDSAGMNNYSVVLANYYANDLPLGKLGIVGPLRINYPRIISVVDFIAKNLSSEMSHYYD